MSPEIGPLINWLGLYGLIFSTKVLCQCFSPLPLLVTYEIYTQLEREFFVSNCCVFIGEFGKSFEVIRTEISAPSVGNMYHFLHTNVHAHR